MAIKELIYAVSGLVIAGVVFGYVGGGTQLGQENTAHQSGALPFLPEVHLAYAAIQPAQERPAATQSTAATPEGTSSTVEQPSTEPSLSPQPSAHEDATTSPASQDSLLKFDVPSELKNAQVTQEEDVHVLENHAVITAHDEATIVSEINAQIISLPVQVGDSVKKGTLLVKFYCVQQEAEFQKAKAQYLKNRVAWDSAKTLNKYQAISRVDYAKSEADYLESKSDVARTGAEAKKCFVLAPFNGKIVTVTAHQSEVVKPGDKLLQIVHNGDLYVRLFVPSTWLSWIKVGDPFTMIVKENGMAIKAVVDKISGKVDTGSQTVEIHGKIIGSEKSLVAGMSGLAKFEDKKDG